MEIPENRRPEGCDENPNRLQQVVFAVILIQNNDVTHYDYKSNFYIDLEYGFIRGHAVTPAHNLGTNILPMHMDPENTDDYVL